MHRLRSALTRERDGALLRANECPERSSRRRTAPALASRVRSLPLRRYDAFVR